MNNDWYEKGELPPVGEKVLVNGDRWEVVAHRGSAAIVINEDDEVELYHYEHLKPLKSKQDQEREAFVEEIEKTIGCVEPINISTVRETAAIIFDKGYRKVKPLTFYDLETCLTRACLQLEPAETQVLLGELLENNHIASEGEYLDTNELTSICHGSKLHKEFKQLNKESK